MAYPQTGNEVFVCFSLSNTMFTGIGKGIKEGSPFKLTVNCCAANGYDGYFPMQDAYDEGGYEARSSRYKAGTAEQLIKEGKALLDSLR